MSNSDLIYRKKVVVSVHDAGVMGELKPAAVLQYFQDAATEHAALIGLSRFDLNPLGLYWVVTRISAQIKREVIIGEELSVLTYPHPPKTVSTTRDFIIEDGDGNAVILGTSLWCVLDKTTHTPKRITPLFPFALSDYRTDFAYGKEAQRVPELDINTYEKKDFEVRNCELDTNIHMNNARYGDMIYNVIDPQIFKNEYISEFDANFMHELKAGDEYSVFYRRDEDIRLSVASQGTECFRARVAMSPKKNA